jgi:hypothetical protein
MALRASLKAPKFHGLADVQAMIAQVIAAQRFGRACQGLEQIQGIASLSRALRH